MIAKCKEKKIHKVSAIVNASCDDLIAMFVQIRSTMEIQFFHLVYAPRELDAVGSGPLSPELMFVPVTDGRVSVLLSPTG